MACTTRLRVAQMSDLTYPPRLKLDWTPEKSAGSLQQVFDHVMDMAEQTLAWYIKAKNFKRFFARSFRVFSVLLGTLAALLPTLGELFGRDGKSVIGAGWTAVLLGIVGALLVLDRFFGFSSGWMRYMSTDLQLRQLIQEFQLEWELEKAGWQGNVPDKEVVLTMLGRCKSFAIQVNQIVRDETNNWTKEFETAIHQIDESVKSKTSPEQTTATG